MCKMYNFYIISLEKYMNLHVFMCKKLMDQEAGEKLIYLRK